MARQENVLTVFVASPSDVEPERGKLEEVIRELNITWSRVLGVRLDLIRWETHVKPGFGADAQDVINEQIPNDYDLFVGIMWCRYGTPTGRAGSGTVEEFQRAKTRYDNDKNSVQLMFYFKDEPISPSLLDLEQLAKVNDFRNSLGVEGGLHWQFTRIEQFEKLIRLHLARQIQSWKSRSMPALQNESNANLGHDVKSTIKAYDDGGDDDDDDGILDLVEISNDKFVELGTIIERIGDAIGEVGKKTNARSVEMNALKRDEKGNANPKEAKQLISKTASDLDQFTSRLEAELPLYHEAMNTGMDAFIKATTMSVDLEDNIENVQSGLDAMRELRNSISVLKESMCNLRKSTSNLPRMTTALNKAKRYTVRSLDKLLLELTDSEQLLIESEKVILELRDESAGHSITET